MDDFPLTKQGVRNLDVLKPKGPSPFKVVRRSAPDPNADDELDRPMGTDIIYTPEAYDDIRDRFPEAQIEEHYDYLHGTRLTVKVDCSLKAWLKFLVAEGWAYESIITQMLMMQKDKYHLVERVLDEVDPGWRSKKKDRK